MASECVEGVESTGWARILLALGVLLLWVRPMRMLLVSSSFGAFVLMLFVMLKDLAVFFLILFCILVAFTSAAVKLYEDDTFQNREWLSQELQS